MAAERQTRTRRVGLWVWLAALLGALAAAVGGGAAYGYFTSSGSGTGSGTTGTMVTVTIATAGTPSSPLLPGGSAGDVVFSVNNPNRFAVSLVGVTLKAGGTITPDASHAGCTTTDSNPVVALNVPPADLPISIAASSTQAIDLAGSASMDVAATTNCQGATFNIPILITVHSL